jgi:ATP-binding cassette subfamily F protein uup
LLGKLAPDRGKVRLGTNLQIAYFDQMREQLDDEKTVMENVCSGSETVTINGKPRHLIGYLQEFLFSPDRAMTPVKILSGGERNRLLLARLFTQPSNLLVMDEPTNDLDIETLELLENLLVEYTGTLLLVSHDRSFLNNVVTSTIVLEGAGVVNEYPGGYDDWVAQRKPAAVGGSWAKYKPQKHPRPQKQPSRRKLSFKDARELECLPARIDDLEREQDQLYKLIADVSLYQRAPQEAAAANQRLEEVKRELGELYGRWEYLENLKYEMEL